VEDLETLLYEERDGVAIVTLNRPDVHNAFNQAMQRELKHVWTSLRTNDDVRAVILTGAGEKAFCTGIDRFEAIEGFVDGEDRDRPRSGRMSTPYMFNDPGENINPKQNDLWKPVIAAVNGMACGGALYMLGESDIIIASENATFFDPHVSYGMTAAFEPIQMLTKMPFQEIMRMALLGLDERMSAERAREIGLVTEVVPRDKLRERAGWAARVIADAPPLAVQGTMRALWTALEISRHQGIEIANLFTRIGSDADALREGQQRFESGKRPHWRLR
jgi:enoyl-CoA hydratase/carnithine racemase